MIKTNTHKTGRNEMKFYLKKEKIDGRIVVKMCIENATEKQFEELKEIGLTNGIKCEGWINKEFTKDQASDLKAIRAQIFEKYQETDRYQNMIILS